MKAVTLVLVSVAAMAASASYAGTPLVEQESYQRGSLAVAAIDRGDWKTAEALLTARNGVRQDDPARLINLGRVYMETGRPGMAVSAWRLAAASQHPFDVETGDGRTISSRQLAEQLLHRYAAAPQSADVN